MNAFDFVLALGALAALIVLPVMVLVRLRRTRKSDGVRDGDGWVLRPSSAAWWAAGFCLIPSLGVLMRWRMGQGEPDYSITNTGPLMGLGLAILGAGVAFWLVLRHRVRTLRFDDRGIATPRRRYAWTELDSAALTRPDSIVPFILELRFRDGGRIRVNADIEGRRRLIAFVRGFCRRNGLPYGREEG